MSKEIDEFTERLLGILSDLEEVDPREDHRQAQILALCYKAYPRYASHIVERFADALYLAIYHNAREADED